MIRGSISITILGALVMVIFLLLATKDQGINGFISSPKKDWIKISGSQIDDSPSYIDLFFFDHDIGVALTVASVKTTYDGGNTWETSHNFLNRAMFAFVNSDHGLWAVGKQFDDGAKSVPVLMHSLDRGLTWEVVAPSSKSRQKLGKRFSVFTGICFDVNGYLWLVGDGGIVKATVTNDKMDVLEVFERKEQLTKLFRGNSPEMWAAGPNGIVASFRSGKWEYQNLGENRGITKILIRENSVWLIGTEISRVIDKRKPVIKGILLRSYDGKTWEDKSPLNAHGLVDGYFDGNRGWVVGLGGSIYSTIDDGNAWVSEQSPTADNLFVVTFQDTNNGWIGGSNSVVLRYQEK